MERRGSSTLPGGAETTSRARGSNRRRCLGVSGHNPQLRAYAFQGFPGTVRIVSSNLKSDGAGYRIVAAREKPILESLPLRDIGDVLRVERSLYQRDQNHVVSLENSHETVVHLDSRSTVLSPKSEANQCASELVIVKEPLVR